MPKQADPSELVSTADLAQQWGVHVRTVHRMVKREQITPYLRMPGRRGAYMFLRSAVAEKPSVSEAA